MTSPYFEMIPHWAVAECFDFPLDFIVNTPTIKADYRRVLTLVSENPYVKVMLSPRWFLTSEKHDVFGTTAAQLSDEEVRKRVLQGVGLAHRTLGEDFTHAAFSVLGAVVASFLMVETYRIVNDGFYKTSFQRQTPEQQTKPYDYRPFYLAVFIAQLEMNYPHYVHYHMSPQLCRQLGLELQEVIGLAQRVAAITGRPKLTFTVH